MQDQSLMSCEEERYGIATEKRNGRFLFLVFKLNMNITVTYVNNGSKS